MLPPLRGSDCYAFLHRCHVTRPSSYHQAKASFFSMLVTLDLDFNIAAERAGRSIQPRFNHCRCLNHREYNQNDVEPEHAVGIAITACAERIEPDREPMHRFHDSTLPP